MCPLEYNLEVFKPGEGEGGFPQHNLLLSCDYVCAEHCEGWWSSGYQCYTRKYYEIVAVCIVMSAQ